MLKYLFTYSKGKCNDINFQRKIDFEKNILTFSSEPNYIFGFSQHMNLYIYIINKLLSEIKVLIDIRTYIYSL